MFFKYYKEVIDSEHRAYAHEVLKRCPVVSSSGKPHLAAIRAMLNKEEKDELYYNSRNGLKRVYSEAAFTKVIEQIESALKYADCLEIIIDSKKYKMFKGVGFNA